MVTYLLCGTNMDYANLNQAAIDERLAQTPTERHSDPTIEEQRRAICSACPEKKQVAGFDQCGACGCFLVFKAKFKFSACPLNKWEVPSDN